MLQRIERTAGVPLCKLKAHKGNMALDDGINWSPLGTLFHSFSQMAAGVCQAIPLVQQLAHSHLSVPSGKQLPPAWVSRKSKRFLAGLKCFMKPGLFDRLVCQPASSHHREREIADVQGDLLGFAEGACC